MSIVELQLRAGGIKSVGAASSLYFSFVTATMLTESIPLCVVVVITVAESSELPVAAGATD